MENDIRCESRLFKSAVVAVSIFAVVAGCQSHDSVTPPDKPHPARAKSTVNAKSNGGIVIVENGSTVGYSYTLAKLQGVLLPAKDNRVQALGGWRPVGAKSYYLTKDQVPLPPGRYGLEFKPITGYATPSPKAVTVHAGVQSTPFVYKKK